MINKEYLKKKMYHWVYESMKKYILALFVISFCILPSLAHASKDFTNIEFRKYALIELNDEKVFLEQTLATTHPEDDGGLVMNDYKTQLVGVKIIAQCLKAGVKWDVVTKGKTDEFGYYHPCFEGFGLYVNAAVLRNPVVRILNSEYNAKTIISEPEWADSLFAYSKYYAVQNPRSYHWGNLALDIFERLKLRYGRGNEPLILTGAMNPMDIAGYLVLVRCIESNSIADIKDVLNNKQKNIACAPQQAEKDMLKYAFNTNPVFNNLFYYKISLEERKKVLLDFRDYLRDIYKRQVQIKDIKTFKQLGDSENINRYLLAVRLEKEFIE